ncbi:hypothetical protein M090_1282, partial [Parabacteroides distasonis str. 3776 Po2 i]
YSLWKEINSILASSADFSNHLYFDINDCVNEICKIEEEIKMKENPSGLLAGL